MDKDSVSVRLAPAGVADALHVQTWFNNEKQITDWGGPGMTYPMNADDFITRVRLDELATFKLEDEHGQMLAFGQYYIRLGRHHLGRLAVAPAARGKGLGQTLVENLLNHARQNEHLISREKALGASLFVMQDNQIARRLYDSLGFTQAYYPEELPSGFISCLYMIKNYPYCN